MKVVMLPSVSGGIGHIARTGALARALRRLDPAVEVEYVLDTKRLRPFNIEATTRLGYRPRLLPELTRPNRDAVMQACFGDADVIVDDAARYLFPWRRAVPRAGWVSLLMHPVGDELWADWPWLVQMDALVWPYAGAVGLPDDLAIVEERILRTGPFLETAEVPGRAEARRRLGLPPGAACLLYATRGFPFGPAFGHAVLSAVYRAAESLRATAGREVRLVLIAVGDPASLRGVPGLPDPLPDWVRVEGVVPAAESLLHTSAADIVVGEGTSTMHEAAALRTPMVLVPGPIQEAFAVARAFGEQGVAELFSPAVPMDAEFAGAFAPLTAAALCDAFAAILAGGEARRARLGRAQALVAGGGGAESAARRVLEVAARRRASLPDA